ncbi:Protein F27C8.5 [Aphelenchoides avenae]|nr:Protein F27C8.5 [Aphelenchus avenae]
MAGSGADNRIDVDPVNELLQKHYARVGRFLDELRLKHAGAGADITVQLSNGSLLRIHSSVAAAHSAYFRQLILDKGRLLHVDLSRSPRSDAVRRVVDYMYNGTIDADLSSIADLLHVASVWQIGSLSEQLEKKLVEHSREPSTTLKAFDIAVLNQASLSPSIHATIYTNAMNNLRKSLRTRNDFAQLSPNAAIALLTGDEPTIRSELDVARILLAYLRLIRSRLHALDTRKVKADSGGTHSQQPSLCTDAHNQGSVQ